MCDSLGSLCIVLHAHIPFVLHHGHWPHGEAWLYEAAAEVYLPLLDVIGEVALHRARPALTIGLTPVLLEQLAHEDFKNGFVSYLNERIGHARHDRSEFEKSSVPYLAELADRWEKWYSARLEQFERIGRDIVKEFADRRREGHIELLTSNATHAYMPLLLNDQMIRAQMACGTTTSEKHLGLKPRGMWLPECAYRPAIEAWKPPVLDDQSRYRPGLETFISAAGVDHFFVESQLVEKADPLGTFDDGQFREVGEAQVHWDLKRGWKSPLEPVGVANNPRSPECSSLARHTKISEQVWSAQVGYPGAAEYLEFHRKHGNHGLRYHRVTDIKAEPKEKLAYEPEETFAKLYEHSQDFCSSVRKVLREHKEKTGRTGVCVAAFDAELFGHWWFEGPQFLRNVLLTLARDPEVKLVTSQEALEQNAPDKVMHLPEGSWGENGNHTVWLNDRTRWMWEIEYRAERQLLWMLDNLPWQANVKVREMVERAGRELLLLQGSDWPFVIHTNGAVDYGIQRFSGHSTRFDRMAAIAETVARGIELTPIQKVQIEEVDLHDNIFLQIELSWWVDQW